MKKGNKKEEPKPKANEVKSPTKALVPVKNKKQRSRGDWLKKMAKKSRREADPIVMEVSQILKIVSG